MYVNSSVTVQVCVCVCYIQFAGYTTSVYVVCTSNYVESNSVQLVADSDTTSAVLPTRRRAYEKTYGMRNRLRNVFASLEVWMHWLGCLGITTVHSARDCPRCLLNSGIHAPHLLNLWGVIIKPPKPPILLNFEHLKHLGPCR